ncbi:CRTAC1 family protein [Paludisphaera soli]|uniref:CRTAC1 family protein n=1 Tax=Paludisphaera soli TaxID=2712865 RepID=UPI0013EB44A7|nr:CRTAC1 family protein [Paludisphaera soli]
MKRLRSLLAAALPSLLCACGDPPASPPERVPSPSAPVPLDPAPAGRAGPRFVEVAESAGLTRVLHGGGPDKDHILESVGTGCAFVDYDADGRLDVFLVNAWALDEEPSRVRAKGRNALYCNKGDGTFEDVTDRAGVADESWGCGVSAADYDHDGRVDLYVTNFGPNRLYRNRGDGTFEQVAERAGVADPGWGGGSSFFDADGDGDLDLYVANYIDATMDEVLAARRTTVWREKVKVLSGPFGMRGGRDRFFRNNGDGTFIDATDDAGMTDTAESYGLGVLASDLDRDGDVDVFVANDSNPNFLYRNDGGGKFTEIGTWSGAGVNGNGVAQADMGVDAADFDGDGRPDILVTTFAQDTATIYRNQGDLAFQDVAVPAGLKAITYNALKWGCGFFDYDLDADVDVVIANGHIYPQVDQDPELHESYRQKPFLLRNDGGKLVDVSASAGPGFQVASSARGLATGDYDDDGDLDLLITAMDSPPLLLRNDTPRSGRWIKLRVVDRHGAPAIGAHATIFCGGAKQSRELRSGSSHQSQNALEMHFGLGEIATIDRIEIAWPAGGKSTLEHVDVDRTITLREPAPSP